MGKFLDTRGEEVLSPYICDRCHLRGRHSEMQRDEDKQGLWVHRDCSDQRDPWKLPPRQADDTSVDNPRPDRAPTDPDVMLQTNDYNPVVICDENGDPLSP